MTPNHPATGRAGIASQVTIGHCLAQRASAGTSGDSRIDMNLVVSQAAYCFSAIFIPCVAWGLLFKFMGRFQLPEASGTTLLWKLQCVAALLTVAICIGLRGRSPLVIALSFLHLGMSLLLITGALLLQLWMLQPMDR